MAASRSEADAKFFCGGSASGIPRSRAKPAAPQAGRLVATATTSNPRSTRLRRFEPAPETATPNLIGEASANHDPVRRGMAHHLAHHLRAVWHIAAIHHQDHAQAHVEGAQHLVVGDLASLAYESEGRRLDPGFALEAGTKTIGQASRQVAEDASTCDVRGAFPTQRGQRFQVRAVRLEQLLAEWPSKLGIHLAERHVLEHF